MPVVYRSTLSEFAREIDRIPYLLAGCDDPASMSPSRLNSPEMNAWRNSLRAAFTVFAGHDQKLPDDCGIMIEYKLPLTERRIDLILTGHDADNRGNYVVIELKQWTHAQAVPEKPGVVIANVAHAHEQETNHPSYQAWSYRTYLNAMNENVHRNHFRSKACAYMHNYPFIGEKDPLAVDPNAELVKETPIFGAFDRVKLFDFLKDRIGHGRGGQILDLIADGRIVPGLKLIDTLSDVFAKTSPRFFTLLDEQHIAYQTILRAAKTLPRKGEKRCVIVKGGPGTGKSVVAVTALVELLRRHRDSENGRNIRFISPTASFRNAVVTMLSAGDRKRREDFVRTKSMISNIFCGSMSFVEKDDDPVPMKDRYSVLICDEAHRLRSQQNRYTGKNQIEDIVNAARVSVFFVDDNQALRPNDIGSEESICAAAAKFHASIEITELTAQFRCGGANGFLNWLADVLNLNTVSSANAKGWNKSNFDFDVLDAPEDVLAYVQEKNTSAGITPGTPGQAVLSGARMLAGYAWPWTKTPNAGGGLVCDIDLGTIKLPWNAPSKSYDWAVDPSRADEVGCVHTSQGLEFDYVGVFIGPDLRYDPITETLYADYDQYYDKGGKVNLGTERAERTHNLLKYVCRCYRVLLSRGVKGARVWCWDKNLAAYLKASLAKSIHQD